MGDSPDLGQLVVAQYQAPDILSRRKQFHRFEQPYINIPDEIAARIDPTHPYTILDVGCGMGVVLLTLAERGIRGTFTGVDISPGMVTATLTAAREKGVRIEASVAAAESLPFPDNTFDIVTTTYALHCVQDIPQTIAEIYRVLQPGGMYILVTRSERSQTNFDTFLRHLAEQFGLGLTPNLWQRCTIEMVPQLIHEFREQTVTTLESTIRLTEAPPFVDYLDTYRSYFIPAPNDELWQRILAAGQDRIEKIIKEHGVYEQPVVHGLCICRK